MAEDFRKKDFGRTLRGYAVEEVDKYLEAVTAEYRRLEKRSWETSKQLADAEKRLEEYAAAEADAAETLDAFLQQQLSLGSEPGSGSSGMIHNTMAGILSIVFRYTQDPADQSGVPVSAGQPCDLSVGCHTAFRNLFHNGKDLIDQVRVQNTFHFSGKLLRKIMLLSGS